MSTNDQQVAVNELKAAVSRSEFWPPTDFQIRALALAHAVTITSHGPGKVMEIAERFRAFLAGETTNV